MKDGSVQVDFPFPVQSAWTADLLEQKLQSVPLKAGKIDLPLRPFEFVTLRLSPVQAFASGFPALWARMLLQQLFQSQDRCEPDRVPQADRRGPEKLRIQLISLRNRFPHLTNNY